MTVRLVYRHASGVLRELHDLREGGRIGWDTWLRGVIDVTTSLDNRLTVSSNYPAAIAATTRPAVADPAHKHASEDMARLPDRYPSDVDSVKHDA